MKQSALSSRQGSPSHPDGAQVLEPVLEALGVRKHFGGVVALDGVDFALRPGQVHALLGPNGAGKSTLIKILSGVVTHDDGELRADGGELQPGHVATVFQELSLVPDLSVQQNILLTREPRTRTGLIDSKAARRQAREVLAKVGLDIHPGTLVSRLPISTRQLVEIAKALHRSARVLILDEPTTSLTVDEVALLFKSVRELASQGVGIVYVTHRLSEVFEIADDVTIIRDGRTAFQTKVSDLDMQRLVAELTGTPVAAPSIDVKPAVPNATTQSRKRTDLPRLTVHEFAGDRFHDVSLELYPGEILGIAGLTGAGRTELLETIFGLRKKTAGTTRVNGDEVRVRSPREAIQQGFALIPEDRAHAGLVLTHSIARNITYANLRSTQRYGWFLRGAARQSVRSLMDMLQVKAPGPQTPLSSLSGGNQQKVVFAKWLREDLRVLLLDEPTRGVDVQSRQELYRVIRELSEQLVGVLVVTSEFEELLELCTHVSFMSGETLSPPVPVSEIPDEQFIHRKLQEGSHE